MEGTLYIVSVGNACRIDVVRDLQKRLKSLDRVMPWRVELIYSETGQYGIMRARVRAVYELLSEQRLLGDFWYRVTPKEARAALEKVIEKRRKGDPGVLITGDSLRPRRRVSVDFTGTGGAGGAKRRAKPMKKR